MQFLNHHFIGHLIRQPLQSKKATSEAGLAVYVEKVSMYPSENAIRVYLNKTAECYRANRRIVKLPMGAKPTCSCVKSLFTVCRHIHFVCVVLLNMCPRKWIASTRNSTVDQTIFDLVLPNSNTLKLYWTPSSRWNAQKNTATTTTKPCVQEPYVGGEDNECVFCGDDTNRNFSRCTTCRLAVHPHCWDKWCCHKQTQEGQTVNCPQCEVAPILPCRFEHSFDYMTGSKSIALVLW